MVGSHSAIVIDGAAARPETLHVVIAVNVNGTLAIGTLVVKGLSQSLAHTLDKNGGEKFVPRLEALVRRNTEEFGRLR